MAVRLFVGNLPYSVTEAQLKELFSAVGPVSGVWLPTDRDTGRPRGFGFVEFDDRALAEEAIRKFHNQPFGGRNLAVNEARPPERGAGGPPPRSSGFDGPRAGSAPPPRDRPPSAGGAQDFRRPPPRRDAPATGDPFALPGAEEGRKDRSRNFGPGAKKGAKKRGRDFDRVRGPKGPLRATGGGRFFGGEDDYEGEDENDLIEDDDDLVGESSDEEPPEEGDDDLPEEGDGIGDDLPEASDDAPDEPSGR